MIEELKSNEDENDHNHYNDHDYECHSLPLVMLKYQLLFAMIYLNTMDNRIQNVHLGREKAFF